MKVLSPKSNSYPISFRSCVEELELTKIEEIGLTIKLSSKLPYGVLKGALTQYKCALSSKIKLVQSLFIRVVFFKKYVEDILNEKNESELKIRCHNNFKNYKENKINNPI